MKNDANILVALDLSEMDTFIIHFLNEFSTLFSLRMITFLHIIPVDEIPEQMEDWLPELDEPLENIVEHELQSVITESFEAAGKTNWEIRVEKGNRSDIMINYTKKHNIDLLVLGLKQDIGGTGVGISSVAAFANCPTLFVPEHAKTTFQQIMVLINFNKISQLVLQNAGYIAQQSKGKVNALHIYGLPVNYFPGSPTDKLREKMNRECNKQFSKMVKNMEETSVSLECEFLLDERNDKASIISKHVKRVNADILMLGLKEINDNSVFFIRTITEKLRVQKIRIPLWIIKERKKKTLF